MSRPLGMGAAALVISGSVAASRLLALGREALLAGLVGVGIEGDLYRQAFTIPDLLNYLLAGAYLTITLIPILSRHLEEGKLELAAEAFTSVFRFVVAGIVALTALMWVLASPIVALLFPEATDPGRLAALTRTVLPAQVFLVAGALLMAVQYAHRRFAIPALAPLLYNAGIIAGGLVGAAAGDPGPEPFLWGAVAGSAVGNFGLQWWGARRTGTWFRNPRRSAVGEYLALALPLMVGQSIAVLDEQFVRLFGQLEVGATSALSFARQLGMVPIGVIAQAAGVAAFPFLARLAAREDRSGLSATTARAARSTMVVALAGTALVAVLALPAVRILFQYGRFSADDTELVARLLTIYGFAIPAWGLHQIVSRHYYAQRRMWKPVALGTAFTLLAVPTWLLLYRAMGIDGFALASVLVMTGYAVSLLVAWGRDDGWEWGRTLGPPTARGALAATTAVLAGSPVVGWVLGPGPWSVTRGVAGLVAGGLVTVAVFGGALAAMRDRELAELLRRDG